MHTDRVEQAGLGAALVAATLLAYANALTAGFQFDDFHAIVDNPAVHSLQAWRQALPGIRPLLKLSYALDWLRGNGEARSFHATNLALHALNVLLLWRLLRLAVQHWGSTGGRSEYAAALGAVVFALHPAATEAVTYVSGRSIVLASTLLLLALWLEVSAAAAAGGAVRRRARGRRALALAAFAAALAVRETSAVMPLVLLAIGACVRPAASWSERVVRLRGYALLLALAALAALYTPGYRVFFGASLGARDLLAQLGGQAVAHGYLFVHVLLGLHSNIDPDLRAPEGWSMACSGGAMLLAGLLISAVAARRRWPWLSLAIAWYLLQLAPSNSLLPRLDLANDRHLYLALGGPALVLAVAFDRLLARALWRPSAGFAALVLLAALGAATAQRNRDYRSETALWQATAKASPRKARAWLNLGYARRLEGDYAGAAQAYAQALALDPGNAQAAINLSLLPAAATPGAGSAGNAASRGAPP